MNIDVSQFAAKGVLGSSSYLPLLDYVENSIEKGPASVTIDLSAITWCNHLPLVALAMAIDRLRSAGVGSIEIQLPLSPTASGFLIRWGFVKYAQSRGCAVIETAPPKDYQRAPKSRVLPLDPFDSVATATLVSGKLRATDAALQALLERAGFRPYDISALADLIVDELCMNAAEHAGKGVVSFAVAHVADPRSEKASRRRETAAEWDAKFAAAVAEEGATEIVVADSGRGIVASLQEAARLARPPRTLPEDIATWAFDAYSTSKPEPGEHTRGLSTVREKVRQLRGVLFVRTSYPEPTDSGKRGLQISWDFMTNPRDDTPQVVEDSHRVRGTQIQILLPRKGLGAHKTQIVSQLNVTPAEASRAIPVEVREQRDLATLRAKAANAERQDVLLVHVAPATGWTKNATEALAKTLAETLTVGHTRLWLLNPDETLLERLRTSAPVKALWSAHGVVVPIVNLPQPPAPPKWAFLFADRSLSGPRGDGDTLAARTTLVDLLTVVLNDGRSHTETLADLPDKERHWVTDALSRNPSVVRHTPHLAYLELEPPFDIDALGREAGQALLAPALQSVIARQMAEQNASARVWYRLPSGLFCRNYIMPTVLESLPAYDRRRIEEWIERSIREIGPRYAISFGPFAGTLLTRAVSALPSAYAIYLDHYIDVHGERKLEQLDDIPSGERAVFLVGITGSGRTLKNVAEKLTERGIDLAILSVIDTMSEDDWRDAPVLERIRRRQRIRTIVSAPIEKLDQERHKALPPDSPECAWPTVHIDPETLIPIATASARDKLWTEGEFWTFVSEAEALSSSRIIYRGLELPSFVWVRNLLHHEPAADRILAEIGRLDPAPEIILAMDDFAQGAWRSPLEEKLKSGPAQYETSWSFDPTDKEGRRIAILCGAASSGTELARALQKVSLAKKVDVFVVLNRMPVEIASAFFKPPRITLRTFQWLSLAAPGSRHRHGRSEALRQLNQYRRSALTNRLIVFIDEKKEELLRSSAYVDDHIDHEFYDPVKRPARTLFQTHHTYDLATRQGREHVGEMVSAATDAESEWARVVLLESMARYDAGHGDPASDEYYETVRELLRGLDAMARPRVVKTVIEAMLLERSIGTRTSAREEPPEAAKKLADELWTRLVSLDRTPHWELASVCIRAIGKLNTPLLLAKLWRVVQIAAQHRETELTLSLELTKIAAQPHEERLRSALQVSRPVDRAQAAEVERALGHLLSDLGYKDTSSGLQPVDWQERFRALESELPDAERGIRALVRSAHDLLPDANVAFFRAADSGHVLADAWPQRDPGDRARPASAYALKLVEKEPTYYTESVMTAAREVEYLGQTADTLRLRGGDMSLLLVRLDRPSAEGESDPIGVLSVQRGYPVGARVIDGAIQAELRRLAEDAARVIARAHVQASMKMSEWAYQQSMVTRASDPTQHPIQQFIDNLRELLGADIGRVVVREGHLWRSRFITGDWLPEENEEVEFPDNDQTYLTVRAAAAREPGLAYDVQARDEGAHPPNRWVHGAVCIPLIVTGKRCHAAVTLWHHTRGWFHAVGSGLLALIGRLGGALYELTLVPEQIGRETAKVRRRQARIQAERINLELFTARVAATRLKQAPAPYREIVGDLGHTLARLEKVVKDYETGAERVVQKQPQPLGDLLQEAAQSLAGMKTEVVYRPNGNVVAPVDADLLREVLAAFVKASQTLGPQEAVSFELEIANSRECAVAVESSSLRSLHEELDSLRERPVTVRGQSVSLVSAFDNIDQHGGRIERASGGFRIVIPLREGEPA